MTETTGSTATPESGNPEGAEDSAPVEDAAEGTASAESDKTLSRRARKRANKAGGGTEKSSGKRAKRGLAARIGLYYRQIIAELRKVVWPTRSELMNYTSVVVVFVAVIIGVVATLDWGFAKLSFWIFG
ncbi:preprotein translocase subunit SecE [Kitasatospora mediocidica]|uniref:preprotein translocase subunit SecE n=1 Tax=Kitasatospora mediocidica TaxID=58352 RepID=UPI000564B7F4|nr:preprotein translocase subunit SecE [Kitasatospora mediocidica]